MSGVKADLLRAAAYIGATNDSPNEESTISDVEGDRIAGVLRDLAASMSAPNTCACGCGGVQEGSEITLEFPESIELDEAIDGGPAFPQQHGLSVGDRSLIKVSGGMSLRDYFAAKAMAQLVNGSAAQNICDRDPRYNEANFAAVVAINAYEFAAAMLKARRP